MASWALGVGGLLGFSLFRGMKVTRPVLSLSIMSKTLDAVASVSTTTWNKLHHISKHMKKGDCSYEPITSGQLDSDVELLI